jgi:hypothetical protein
LDLVHVRRQVLAPLLDHQLHRVLEILIKVS